ncbi:unnamed protein product [Penicillium salamii]|uniref:Uncharacterized protein n=1 Tax=Penicillium salamii TaxID=1612424 RepID=A0A9W4NN02_9EURO|nr:unnamed protein product [Penicillium salamii]CAG8078396.1 unnamed protein product [Penicillium salamii]CAG8086310.1 unnamed protein product [Penicillium salamii]CAG8092899.1 unnamed protein product [Penicillium salamii]CAG8257400.1 unnamed protein product [Penicillium salamii]
MEHRSYHLYNLIFQPAFPDRAGKTTPATEQKNQIGVGLQGLASALGKANTTLHWGAGVNGDDIEFVFGTTDEQRPSGNPSDFQHRAVCLFLLDFGQSDIVDLSQECEPVHRAFKAAIVTGDNQHFIPHANQPDLFAALKRDVLQPELLCSPTSALTRNST